MSPAALAAAVVLAWLALALIVTLLWGSIVRTMGNERRAVDRPAPIDPGRIDAGHRAATRTALVLGAGVCVMLALERMA